MKLSKFINYLHNILEADGDLELTENEGAIRIKLPTESVENPCPHCVKFREVK